MPDPVLSVTDLHAWYGESHVLHGVTLDLKEGETLAILGRNGAGKTSTLRAIMGVIPRRSGSVKIHGRETIRQKSHAIARLGLAYVPEERGIFASLTAQENLLLPPVISPGGLGIEEIYELFPNLAERRNSPGTRLSGGEQQMLAIARALCRDIKVLLLDEPYEGLAPVIVDEIEKTLITIKELGITTVIVEQTAVRALELADRSVILDTGSIVFDGTAAEVLENESLRAEYLAI
mgnify:CR=1 FL=1